MFIRVSSAVRQVRLVNVSTSATSTLRVEFGCGNHDHSYDNRGLKQQCLLSFSVWVVLSVHITSLCDRRSCKAVMLKLFSSRDRLCPVTEWSVSSVKGFEYEVASSRVPFFSSSYCVCFVGFIFCPCESTNEISGCSDHSISSF